MHIDKSTPVGRIALASQAALDALERLGIDYACSGHCSLERACSAAGVDVAVALPALTDAVAHPAAAGDRDYRYASLTELLDYIVNDLHAATRAALAHTAELLSRCAASGTPVQELRALLDGLSCTTSANMQREEAAIFTRVRELAAARYGKGPWPDPSRGALRPHVESLKEGHERARELAHELRVTADALLGDAPDQAALRDAVHALERGLHVQMHLENNVLAPRAMSLEPQRAPAA